MAKFNDQDLTRLYTFLNEMDMKKLEKKIDKLKHYKHEAVREQHYEEAGKIRQMELVLEAIAEIYHFEIIS